MSEASLKDVMRTFPQGVTVVTAEGDDGPRGITVSSFTSVAVDPPLILVCIMREARAHDAIAKGEFVVNVLAQDQGSVSDHFASPNLTSKEQFENHSFPELEGCLGYLHCRVVDRTSQGTHTVFFAEVRQIKLGAAQTPGKPLVFCGRQYWGLSEIVHER